MSHITEMVLIVPFDEARTLEAVNTWCQDHDQERRQVFEALDTKAAGGNKMMGPMVFAMCGNYFPYYDLIGTLLDGALELPPGSMLYVDNESDIPRAFMSTWDKGVVQVAAKGDLWRHAVGTEAT